MSATLTAARRGFPHRRRCRREPCRRDPGGGPGLRPRRAGWRRPGSRSRSTTGQRRRPARGARPTCPRCGRARTSTPCRKAAGSTARLAWSRGSRRSRRSGSPSARSVWWSFVTKRPAATAAAGGSATVAARLVRRAPHRAGAEAGGAGAARRRDGDRGLSSPQASFDGGGRPRGHEADGCRDDALVAAAEYVLRVRDAAAARSTARSPPWACSRSSRARRT